MQVEIRPGKGRDAGIAFGAALLAVQTLVPEGVLTQDGEGLAGRTPWLRPGDRRQLGEAPLLQDAPAVNEREHEELHKVALKLEKVSTDVDWLKRAFWIVAAAVVAQLIVTVQQGGPG